MAASTARHETRALLRAHLAASTGYRHVTRHCPICHRLLRLAMEPEPEPQPQPAEPAEPAGCVTDATDLTDVGDETPPSSEGPIADRP